MSLDWFTKHPGAPIPDVDDPMKEGVGAASWAKDRSDRLDLTVEGEPKIMPMSTLEGWHVDQNDRDPRGMDIIAGDGEVAGKVTDIWVDRSEPAIRYLQIDVVGAEGGPFLAPMGFCSVTRDGIRVGALHKRHFADIPVPKEQDRITLLEEDKIAGWFAGGFRYASADRLEPLI